MIVFVLIIFCLAVFPVQFWLCTAQKPLAVKLIPVYVLAAYLAVSLVLANGAKYFGMQPDTALVGVLLLVVGIYLVIADALAWLICLAKHIAQKRSGQL